MESILGLRGSKKTSESGVWVNDEDVKNCMVCKAGFGMLTRKHHCRQCGSVVCGDCSQNRKFLESSRTGAPKRICDTCHDKDRGRAGGDDDDDDDDDEGAAAALAKASVGGSSGSAGEGSAGGFAPPPPAVSSEEAIAALKDHSFEGRWVVTLRFAVVDIGGARGGAPSVPGIDLSAYNKSSGGARGKGEPQQQVRAGSALEIALRLKPKGANYFQGECGNFHQFGRDG
jgi:hypothetical protein